MKEITKIKCLFFRFLKEEKIYQYYTSVCNIEEINDIALFEIPFLLTNNLYKNFQWDYSIQGRKFWMLINIKWLKLLYKQQILIHVDFNTIVRHQLKSWSNSININI